MTANKNKYVSHQIWVGAIFALIAECIAIILLTTDAYNLIGRWVILNLIPEIIAVLLTGHVHSGDLGVFFHIASAFQWFIVGYFISKFYFRFLHKDLNKL